MTIVQLYTIIGVQFTLLVSVLAFLAKLVFELNNSVTEIKALEPERKSQSVIKHTILDTKISKLEQTTQDHAIRLVKLESKND